MAGMALFRLLGYVCSTQYLVEELNNHQPGVGRHEEDRERREDGDQVARKAVPRGKPLAAVAEEDGGEAAGADPVPEEEGPDRVALLQDTGVLQPLQGGNSIGCFRPDSGN